MLSAAAAVYVVGVVGGTIVSGADAIVALMVAIGAFLQAITALIMQRVQRRNEEIVRRSNRRSHDIPPPDGRHKREEDKSDTGEQ